MRAMKDGKIARIGKNLNASAGAQTIDATGKYVTPGIIDCHSHLMLDAINEGLDNFEVHIGFKQGYANLAHCCFDVSFAQAALPPQVLEYFSKLV